MSTSNSRRLRLRLAATAIGVLLLAVVAHASAGMLGSAATLGAQACWRCAEWCEPHWVPQCQYQCDFAGEITCDQLPCQDEFMTECHEWYDPVSEVYECLLFGDPCDEGPGNLALGPAGSLQLLADGSVAGDAAASEIDLAVASHPNGISYVTACGLIVRRAVDPETHQQFIRRLAQITV
jgi:hypothetical protein